MPGYFVTATGTDIGKTYVTAGLLRHARALGEGVSALKPVLSGYSPARMAESDPGVLLAALGGPVTEEAVAHISPWRFEAPLSPDMAAAREGRSVDFDEVVEFCRARLAEDRHTIFFVEGVGGVLVPLDERHTVRDWMAALKLPVVLVTGSYLGTISHTLTALEALDRAGLRTAVVVLNESAESTVPLEDTQAALVRFVKDIPVVSLRRAAEIDFENLRRALRARA